MRADARVGESDSGPSPPVPSTRGSRGAFLRFVVVGALNTLLTYALYFVLFEAMNVHFQVAYAIAYVSGVLLQFVLHSRYVFRVPLRWGNLAGYPPIHLVLYGFGALLLWLLVAGFEFEARSAPLWVIALSVPLSFFLTRRWLTRSERGGVLALRLSEIVLALGAATFAGVYVLTSTSYIVAYSWRQLLFDQVKQYLPLLEGEFPANLLVQENGHRPIFPNLVRYADIAWGHADQSIPIFTALAFSLASLLLIVVAAARTRVLSLAERGAVILLGAIALFWLGNARMLLHANEAIQVSLTTFAVVAMGFCAWQARRSRAWGSEATGTSGSGSAATPVPSLPHELSWMLLASMLAFVATFSFGSGIAAFPALLVLAIMQRASLRAIALAASIMIATLVLYLFVLPGDDGVRASLAVRPLDSLVVAARWLSAPFVNGWLGLSEPEIGAWIRGSLAAHGIGGWLVGTADAMASRSGTAAFVRGAGTVIGLGGLAAVAWLTFRRLRRPRALGALEALAFALALFGAATGLLIGLARLTYFDVHPGQILADRYGVWPCLLWLGLGILVILRGSGGIRTPWFRLSLPVLALLAGVMAWPSHLGYRDWGMAVYRKAERGAAAIAGGLRDPDYSPSGHLAPLHVELRVIDLLREKRLAMFIPRSPGWVGRILPLEVAPAPDPEPATVLPEPMQWLKGHRALAFSGWVVDKHVRRRYEELVVLDSARRIVGIARWSMDPRPIAPGLLMHPRWHGFDGYARVPRDCAPLLLAGIGGDVATPLAKFDPCAGGTR